MIPNALLVPLVCGTHVQAVVNCEVIATKKLSNAVLKSVHVCHSTFLRLLQSTLTFLSAYVAAILVIISVK